MPSIMVEATFRDEFTGLARKKVAISGFEDLAHILLYVIVPLVFSTEGVSK